MPFAIKYEHEYAGTLYLAYDGAVGARRRVRFDRDISVARRYPNAGNARTHLESLRDYLTHDDGNERDSAPVMDPKLSVIAI
jgi:hypothetical protein